ncbi:MAG: amino acid-binding protein [Bacteroidales bacterium]|nr:amino acid-binding protein [Bacteroidales bacterium]
MTVQQISIFVENKAGTLLKVLELLKESNIQIVASTIADTVEYGIYRIICSEPGRAYTTLQSAGISVALSDVFALTLDNVPGRAADAVKFLSQAGIGITYMYSFLFDGKGILIFKTDNTERTREVIEANKLAYITDEDLASKV